MAMVMRVTHCNTTTFDVMQCVKGVVAQPLPPKISEGGGGKLDDQAQMIFLRGPKTLPTPSNPVATHTISRTVGTRKPLRTNAFRAS